jgi:hypothetical protein|tara:strand:+ start:4516 stop:4692 length:177 start_codon:yes stop_codon:yes gene_type:complete
MDIDRIIDIVHCYKEEVTNTSGAASLGFDPETDTPPVSKKKKKRYIYGKGYRKLWQEK